MSNGVEEEFIHQQKMASWLRRETALLAATDALKWERQEYLLAREFRQDRGIKERV